MNKTKNKSYLCMECLSCLPCLPKYYLFVWGHPYFHRHNEVHKDAYPDLFSCTCTTNLGTRAQSALHSFE